MKLFYWVQRGSLSGTIHPRSNRKNTTKYQPGSRNSHDALRSCLLSIVQMRINPISVQTERLRGGNEAMVWLMTDGATRRRRRFAHLGSQLLHVRVDLIQQVVALLEQRVLGVHEGQHLDGTGAFCLLTVQMFVRGIYHKGDTEDDARVCASAGTHSIEDLKFLLGLEDVDLQRTRTNVFYSFIHIWFILLLSVYDVQNDHTRHIIHFYPL